MPDTLSQRTADALAEDRAGAGPLAVEVVRGDTVESRHRAACAVTDASGRLVHAWGDVERPIYPRSAIKSIQALAIVETGAADRFGLGDAELALACASHGGEPMHTAVVEPWLARLGLGVGDLECGIHPPSHAASAEALFRAGITPSAMHNNCSGKHSGMLTTAVHMGEPTKGYVAADHPVQRRIAGVIGEMAGVDMTGAPCATDGCSIPTYAIPLSGLATAMARLGDPSGLAPERAAAAGRIRAAVAAHPEMVAGTGRFCTALNAAAGARIFAKTGAEGVYAVALPESGLGIAIKVADGAGRAAEVALCAVLRRLGVLDDALEAAIADFAVKPLINHAGRRVGEVRPAAGWPPADG